MVSPPVLPEGSGFTFRVEVAAPIGVCHAARVRAARVIAARVIAARVVAARDRWLASERVRLQSCVPAVLRCTLERNAAKLNAMMRRKLLRKGQLACVLVDNR